MTPTNEKGENVDNQHLSEFGLVPCPKTINVPNIMLRS